MIDPAKVALFVPGGLKKFKLDLFERIAGKIRTAGGRIVRDDERRLLDLPNDIIPIVGCTPALRPIIDGWREQKSPWIYWDRGYYFRVFATWLPRGGNGGMYRWHVNSYQLQAIRNVPPDRFNARKPPVQPWSKGGRHIVIAAPTEAYSAFHRTHNWLHETIETLSRCTDRQLVVRGKESKRPLADDLKGAHALVAHASNAAVEAVIMGCPVFVHRDSAAALVGITDLSKIEAPVYPERQPWLNSLAYSQFNETELCDGTLWRLIA
jgi:hypothetical protein